MNIDKAVWAIIHMALETQRIIEKPMRQYSLRAQSYQALQALADAPSAMTVTEVIEHLTGTEPDVARIMDRLEKIGYVTRVRDEQDRRRVLLSITPDGRHVVDTLGRALTDAYREVQSDILPVQLNILGAVVGVS